MFVSQKTLLLVAILFVSFVNRAATATLSGDYLGQMPPGAVAKPFAPGIVSTEFYELTGVFTPDMKEFYFIRNGGEIAQSSLLVMRNINGTWQKSVVSKRIGTPLMSPDGKVMHLGRRYMQRNQEGWGEVAKLDAPFAELRIMRLSSSQQGTYFFDEFKEDFTGDIRYSRLEDGKYQPPQLVSPNINNGRAFHPFIAPDESYLIFDSTREGGFGGSDLYISYRLDDGSWGDPINLGKGINSPGWDALGTVTPDGKYMFFNRNINPDNYDNVDILWVSAEFIDALKPKA